MVTTRRTTIHCTREIQSLWPTPLADQWLQQYPGIFDTDDLRLARTQPRYHFCEWFAAIHLFHRDGARSLIEQYAYRSHPAKLRQISMLLSDVERKTLDRIREDYHVQLPDLLVFIPRTKAYWFAEVKGPHDRVSEKQRRSHEAITAELQVPVEIIEVKL